VWDNVVNELDVRFHVVTYGRGQIVMESVSLRAGPLSTRTWSSSNRIYYSLVMLPSVALFSTKRGR
jgi:hypothetical protein